MEDTAGRTKKVTNDNNATTGTGARVPVIGHISLRHASSSSLRRRQILQYVSARHAQERFLQSVNVFQCTCGGDGAGMQARLRAMRALRHLVLCAAVALLMTTPLVCPIEFSQLPATQGPLGGSDEPCHVVAGMPYCGQYISYAINSALGVCDAPPPSSSRPRGNCGDEISPSYVFCFLSFFFPP